MAGEISQDLLARTRTCLNEPAAITWQDSELYRYLVEAQRDLVGERLPDAAVWQCQEIVRGTWTNGVYEYSLPGDFLRARYAAIGGASLAAATPAVYISLEEFNAMLANNYFGASKTNPFWSVDHNLLKFHTGSQNPDVATYWLLYVRQPTDLSSTVDPEVARIYEAALVDFAVSRAREQQRNFGEAQRMMAHYKARVAAICERYGGEGKAHQGVPGDPAYAKAAGGQ